MTEKSKEFSIKILIALPLFTIVMMGCENRSVSTLDKIEACQFSDINIDSLIFERDKDNDSTLFEQVKNCKDLPQIVELKLDLFNSLNRNSEALEYLNTLDRKNFNEPYDSLVYRIFFESRLSENIEVKIKLFKIVTEEMEKHLVKIPLDTLALGNYCLYTLEYRNKEYVFEKIDSMAFANGYDPTYAFIMSLYFPDQYKHHQKRILQ